MLNLWSRLAEPIALRLPGGPAPTAPIVIIGFGKSGKSLLANALAKSGVLSRYPTEGNLRVFMPGLYPWHSSDFDGPPLWYDPAPTCVRIKEIYAGPHGDRIRRAIGLFELMKGKPVIIDNGNLTYWLDAFLGLFPDARLISVVRDPRQAVPSVKDNLRHKIERHHRFRELGFLTDPQLLGLLTRRWLESWNAINALERGGQTMIVRFHELISTPGASIDGVFDWLGSPRAAAPSLPAFEETCHAKETHFVDAELRSAMSGSDLLQFEKQWGPVS